MNEEKLKGKKNFFGVGQQIFKKICQNLTKSQFLNSNREDKFSLKKNGGKLFSFQAVVV
jgi:hypothetical protein